MQTIHCTCHLQLSGSHSASGNSNSETTRFISDDTHVNPDAFYPATHRQHSLSSGLTKISWLWRFALLDV
jgi:hypothetical protein